MTSESFIASITGFDRLPVAGFVLELDGTVAAANQAGIKLLGASPVGNKVWQAMPVLEGMWATVVPAVVLRSEHSVEVVLGARMAQLAMVLREAGGKRMIVAFVASLAEQRPQTTRISQRLESLGLVAGGIAHEVNNQLVSVIAEAGTAREDEGVSDDTRDALGRIETAAKRMTDLTKQLLAYAGRGRFVTVLLDPDALLADKAGRLRKAVRATATLDIVPGAGTLAIEADRSLLAQVVHELVENASEALRRDDGVITVSSRMVTDRGLPWWELEVKDDGIGMDAEMVAKIFDPFYSTKPERHGLGLSAVLGIVHRLGGVIDVTSQPYKGSTFRVRLPVVPGVAPLRRRSTSEQQPIESLAGLRILVADDEPSVRATIQRLLERRAAEPVIVADGAQAEEKLRTEAFDLVLLDVMMPRRTGYQLVPIARVTQPGVPVLLMSGYTEQARGIEPPDGFIEKPFNGSMLEAAIKAVLLGENGNGRAGSDNGG